MSDDDATDISAKLANASTIHEGGVSLDHVGASVDLSGKVTGRDDNSTTVLHGSGAVAAEGGIAAGAQGIAIGGNVSGNVYLGGDDERKVVPRQAPQTPAHYVTRHQAEKELKGFLTGDTSSPTTYLFGLPGIGKTSLSARVIRSLSDDVFPGGVLWGDLASSTPSELLWTFLSTLDRKWRHNPIDPRTQRQRGAFRQILLDGKRLLIVLDSATSLSQIQEVLPDDLGECRALVISIAQLTSSQAKGQELRLGPFTESETLELFTTQLGVRALAEANALREISEHLEYLPQMVASAALELASGKTLPGSYLRKLRQAEGPVGLLGKSMSDGLELARQGLDTEVNNLLELTGVLGEGDWSAHMLAGVALRPVSKVEDGLAILVGRGLVEAVSGQRYRIKTLIREFVQERLRLRSPYELQAAYMLLTHYCVEFAQDILAELSARQDLRSTSNYHADRWREFSNSETLTLQFKSRLLSEMTHFRKVQSWTISEERWELIRRFAYLAHVGLVQGLILDGMSLQSKFTLNMATMREPIFRPKDLFDSDPSSRVWSLIGTEINMNIGPPKPGQHCELALNLVASRITRGILHQIDLVDVEWIGVQASNIILKGLDMIGSRFLNCDFNRSLWIECDARRVNLQGSNLSHALLKQVNLRGANLRGVNFTGAILEKIDLRNADLRGANFTSALVNQLDLRGCQLEGAIWVNIDGNIAEADDVTLLDQEINAARKETMSKDVQPPYPLDFASRIKSWVGGSLTATDLSRTDLRGMDFTGADLQQANLYASDLRAADLTGVDLESANLSRADLCMANLRGASLKQADLQAANLHGTTLIGVDLESANLRNADLSGTILISPSLEAACLHQVDLSEASLAGVNFRGVDLTEADLFSANLANTDFTGANLQGANLRGANLSSASLLKAQLRGACLVDANLTKAVLLEANLSDSDLTRAQLDISVLNQLSRLRGATLPNGARYPGHLKLAGDIADAVDQNLNLSDRQALAKFYGVPLEEYEFPRIGWFILESLMKEARKSIDGLQADDDTKDELKDYVEKIEAEVKKGGSADLTRLSRWLRYMGAISTESLQLIVEVLTNGDADIPASIQDLARQQAG